MLHTVGIDTMLNHCVVFLSYALAWLMLRCFAVSVQYKTGREVLKRLPDPTKANRQEVANGYAKHTSPGPTLHSLEALSHGRHREAHHQRRHHVL